MPRVAKIRNDSVKGKQAILDAAKNPTEPVAVLDEVAMYYFGLYSSTRPSFSWSKGDLVRLTKIAERCSEVDRLTEKIKQDGYTVINQRGTEIVNPLVGARDQLERTIMAAERSLSIYSPMEGSNKVNTHEQAKEVEKAQKADDSDLLA